MPELPEVETMRRGVAPVVGSRIIDASRPRSRYRPIQISPGWRSFRRRLVGARIDGVGRVGKRVVIEISGDQRLVLEPRMTGLVLIASPPNKEHLRLSLHLAGGAVDQLLFWDRRGLGVVRLLDGDEFDALYGPDKLGPDALLITAGRLREQLAASRREIKVALLDQRGVAGVGNIYASEILHLAKIHPCLPCSHMTSVQWNALVKAMRAVLKEAIRHEGSTLGDGSYRNALNQNGRYQNHHRVYNRAAKPCPRCKHAAIHRIVQAQRSTFFCASCQLLGRRSVRTRPRGSS